MLAALVARLMVLFVALCALLFGSAGRWDLWNVWAYIGVFMAGGVAGMVVMLRTDPSLLREREQPGPGGQDPHLRRLALGVFVAHWVIAGVDVGRMQWSPPMPEWLMAAGLIGIAAALGMACWATSVNRFHSSVARIQRERGHHLITTGPYRFLRHPTYAGSMLMSLASPLALGSWWSALPVPVGLALFLRRLMIEDRLLHAELEGYSGYARRVPYRVLPGIW